MILMEPKKYLTHINIIGTGTNFNKTQLANAEEQNKKEKQNRFLHKIKLTCI